MKSRNDLIELIKQLDTTLNTLDREYDIYDGGCVFVSWVLASNFEKIGVDYKVVVYTLDGERSQDVGQIIRNHNLCHMSILVNAGKPYELGGEIDDKMVKEHDIHKFTTYLTPDEIKDFYIKGEFNGDGFDESDIENVESEIEMTFDMCW